MNNLSDMHFHLDGFPNHLEVYNEINKYEQYTLCVTNSLDIYEACVKTYKETKYVRFAVGHHPKNDHASFSLNRFIKFARNTKYIGEVGLDFSVKSKLKREQQLNIFSNILSSVGEEGKIFSLHSYKAEDEIYELIKEYANKSTFILHWYNGKVETLRKLINIGCYFSLNIKQLRLNPDIIKEIPLNRILIETDEPHGNKSSNLYMPSKLSTIYGYFDLSLGTETNKIIYNNLLQILKKHV